MKKMMEEEDFRNNIQQNAQQMIVSR